MADDDEHRHLHDEQLDVAEHHHHQQQPACSPSAAASCHSTPNKKQGKCSKSAEPPLNAKSRHRRPYQTGCLGCLSRVPGVSLASWLIICFGCGCYVGGNLVWTKLTADFIIGKMCPIYPCFVLAVAGATIILATKFLIINHCASGETSRHTLVTPGRNACTRCCDGFALTLAYIFQFLWTLLFTVQVIPLLLLFVTTTFREPTLRGCVDLRHYGMRVKAPGAILPLTSVDVETNPTTTPLLPVDYVSGSNTTHNSVISYRISGPYRKSAHMCGRDLEHFTERSWSFVVSLSFAIGGCFFVLIGMLNFIICLAGNYKHVKEIRHLPYMVAIGGSGDECITTDNRDEHCRMLNHEG